MRPPSVPITIQLQLPSCAMLTRMYRLPFALLSVVSEHYVLPVPHKQDLWKHVPTLRSPCPTQAGSLIACPNTAQSLSHAGRISQSMSQHLLSLSHAGRISHSMSQHCTVPVPCRQDLSKHVPTLHSPCPTRAGSLKACPNTAQSLSHAGRISQSMSQHLLSLSHAGRISQSMSQHCTVPVPRRQDLS